MHKDSLIKLRIIIDIIINLIDSQDTPLEDVERTCFCSIVLFRVVMGVILLVVVLVLIVLASKKAVREAVHKIYLEMTGQYAEVINFMQY